MSGPTGQQDDLIAALRESLGGNSFVKLTLSRYAGAEKDLKSIHVRRVVIKRVAKLSLTYRYKTRDIVKNEDDVAALEILRRLLADCGAAVLMTTAFDLAYDRAGRLTRSAPTQTEAPSTDHDRAKARPVAAAGQSWMRALGIADADGQVLKSAQDKYRQINRYVELLAPLIAELAAGPVRVADMGSGKGYLTFALYDYLRNVVGREARVTGVEYRADMVDLCNRIAAESGFAGLGFVEGIIADYDAAGITMLIALHACDTATDDAIAKGIAAGAELIVVAPCCHKQIRREMERHKVANAGDFLLRHGIFRERQAEMVTDAIRALVLEYFGYETKVFEFISDSHTPKNVMITGRRTSRADRRDPAVLARIAAAKEQFGISRHYLEQATGL